MRGGGKKKGGILKNSSPLEIEKIEKSEPKYV